MEHRPPLDPTPLHAARRHARLWRRFLLQAIVRETHYRANFLATWAIGLLQFALSLIPVLVMFSFTDDVNGWSRAEVIALAGMYEMATAILWFGVQANMHQITQYIRQGDLDMILTRPVSGLFYIILRWVKPAEVFMIVSGLAVIILGLSRADAPPNAAGILQALLLLASGIILVTCAWAAIVMTAFWFTSTGPVAQVAADLLQAGRYPLSFYPTAIRLFFGFVFPVGFASTFPVEALTGRGSWTITITGVLLSTLVLILLRSWWRFAVRFYSSASS
jgi:ABC-2 type transport system permease protein